jgi:CubicO group peptidase (beta-lactamase class C family)
MRQLMTLSAIAITFVSLFVLLSPPLNAQETSDYWPTEGWQTSTPEEQGMDSELLAQAMDSLMESSGVHSVLVIRHGYVVLDAYFDPFTEGSLHDLASVTKSFTATLIGVAINQGYIESVQQPVLSFFPERDIANIDANKEAMTLEDLLTMQSGLDCVGIGEHTLYQMAESPDWVQFALDLPMAQKPGTHYVYCGPNTHLLSAVIQEATGMSALEFAQQQLFGPLGISDVIWPSDPQGVTVGWGDLRMAPHDMAKLGYLYLHDGVWDGQRLLPEGWVQAATTPYTRTTGLEQYGYSWWLPEPGIYHAMGNGGQYIYVVPDQDLVVVATQGGTFESQENGPSFDTVLSLILPAITSDSPLPPDPDGTALLESKIHQVATPVQIEPESVPPLPETARRISGKTYLLDTNTLGLSSLSLTFQDESQASFRLTLVDQSALEFRVGLDNVFRRAPGRYGLTAEARGRWESETDFTIELNEVGNISLWDINLSFEDDHVAVLMRDRMRDWGAGFNGALANTEAVPAPADVFVFVEEDPMVVTWMKSGPGQGYPKTGEIQEGILIDVIGRNEAGDWLQIASGDWVRAAVVTVMGDVDSLPVVEVSISAEEAFAAQWEAENRQAFENPLVIDEAILQPYVGTYDVPGLDTPITLFIEDGILMVKLPDRTVPLHPVSETLFVIDPDTHLEFLRIIMPPPGVAYLRRDGTQSFGERVQE